MWGGIRFFFSLLLSSPLTSSTAECAMKCMSGGEHPVTRERGGDGAAAMMGWAGERRPTMTGAAAVPFPLPLRAKSAWSSSRLRRRVGSKVCMFGVCYPTASAECAGFVASIGPRPAREDKKKKRSAGCP